MLVLSFHTEFHLSPENPWLTAEKKHLGKTGDWDEQSSQNVKNDIV